MQNNTKTPYPIDAVITWVDGNDYEFQKKIGSYTDSKQRNADYIAGNTRYMSKGEIYYCVASILRFAPYIRKIFIVADDQRPAGLDEFVKLNFPDTATKIEIVDHRTIFSGYEQYLPTFCSKTIETMLFRIPDLSEHFIYFNDDFFLVGDAAPEYWYRDGKSVAVGWWKSLVMGDFLSFIKPRKNGKRPIGFKDGMRRTAHFMKHRFRYFHIQHAPHPLKKSVFERFYAENPGVMESNIQYRVRNRNQLLPQCLYYLIGFRSGDCVIKPERSFYMKPVSRGPGYVDGKIAYFEKHRPVTACVGSLDQATEQDREKVFSWLRQVIGIRFCDQTPKELAARPQPQSLHSSLSFSPGSSSSSVE